MKLHNIPSLQLVLQRKLVLQIAEDEQSSTSSHHTHAHHFLTQVVLRFFFSIPISSSSCCSNLNNIKSANAFLAKHVTRKVLQVQQLQATCLAMLSSVLHCNSQEKIASCIKQRLQFSSCQATLQVSQASSSDKLQCPELKQHCPAKITKCCLLYSANATKLLYSTKLDKNIPLSKTKWVFTVYQI